jgi:hypothetical protein
MPYGAIRALALLALILSPAGDAVAQVPLTLSPTGEGAAMVAALPVVSAAVKLPRLPDTANLGGGVSFELEEFDVRCAYRDELASPFGRAAASRSAGSAVLADWLGEVSGLALSRAAGPVSATLAAGQGERQDVPWARVMAGEFALEQGWAAVTLRAARRDDDSRLAGVSAAFGLDGLTDFELAGSLVEEGTSRRQTGVAFTRRQAFWRRDHLSAHLQHQDDTGQTRVSLSYGTAIAFGTLGLEAEGTSELGEYRTAAEWRLRF